MRASRHFNQADLLRRPGTHAWVTHIERGEGLVVDNADSLKSMSTVQALLAQVKCLSHEAMVHRLGVPRAALVARPSTIQLWRNTPQISVRPLYGGSTRWWACRSHQDIHGLDPHGAMRAATGRAGDRSLPPTGTKRERPSTRRIHCAGALGCPRPIPSCPPARVAVRCGRAQQRGCPPRICSLT